MERLTWKRDLDGYTDMGLRDGVSVGDAICRLADYEDTGLEPKQAMLISNVLREVGETYNCWFDYVVNCVLENSHLKEIAQAEKDGRLVVLPCKPGTDVYINSHRAVVKEFFGYRTERYLRAQFYDNAQYIDIPFEEIGKTVFLTREEAEEALKKREEANDEID